MKMTIGREEKCDYTIEDRSVSGHHADLILESKKKFFLVDSNSTNGTFINGKRISKHELLKTDKVMLGKLELNADEIISQLELNYKRTKTDFSEEYNEMLVDFEEYQKKKDKIMDPSKVTKFVKIGFGILFLVVILWIVSKSVKDISLEQIRNLFFIGLGLISIFGLFFTKSPGKKSELLGLLKLEYEDKLVCPKCRSKFINENISYWRGKNTCKNTKCDAKFK
jgi:pSer/pThr/pTyr-binding forkhead associated (FHA) protein